VRHRTAAEDLFQLAAPAGPGLADDVDGVRGHSPRVGPLEQEGRDRLVEELVGRLRRPDHVVLDLPPRHRLEDLLRGLTIAPAPPLDQQPALGVRVEIPHLAQQLAPSRPVEPRRGEHKRDVFARGRQRLELRHRVLRRSHADDAIAPRVAVEQLAFEIVERTLVFVDCEKDRIGHGHQSYRPSGALFRQPFQVEQRPGAATLFKPDGSGRAGALQPSAQASSRLDGRRRATG
jgi:hypothetical protein